MPAHRVKLKERQEVARGTMSFHFERPAGFQFTAGQFMDIRLLDPPDFAADDSKRHFTIASPPSEGNLMIATRMRDSAFKRALKTIPIGSDVEIDEPKGKFTLHSDESRPAVFFAGGIGITAPRSILLQALHENLSHRIFHFYSDQRPEEAAFLEELERIARENPHYTLIPTMTEAERSGQQWRGETRRIDMNMIKEHIEDVEAPIYYASGPPKMVKAMKEMLKRPGIDEHDIRTEEYTGY